MKFEVNSKVKICTSKNSTNEFRIQRKGEIGIVKKRGESLGKICYYVKFKRVTNWINEEDLILVDKN